MFENRPLLTLATGTTRDELCPVAAMLSYLAWRPPAHGFLFLFHDGIPLSWDRLCRELRLALQVAGVDNSGYSRFGRWKSAPFLDSICTDQASLTSISHHKYIGPRCISFHLTVITTLISTLLLFGLQRCSTSICVVVM